MLNTKEPFLEPFLRWLRLRRVLPHIPQNSVVLDIGCGQSATFLRAISPYVKQGFGIDFKVENNKLENIQIIQCKFDDKLPFKDSSFDIVTMLAVLEHIENDHQILREIYRVLIPGGKLIITVPSIWSQPVLEFLSYKLNIVSEAEIRDHKRYYDQNRLRNDLIKITGFSNFSHQYFQFWMNNFCTVVKRDK